MLVVTSKARVVSCQETWRPVAIMHLAKIRRACQNIVVRIIRVCAKTVSDAQPGVGFGHDLHQAHRAFWRDGAHLAAAFDARHGPYSFNGNLEPSRRFGDEGREEECG